jgi:hypothetical protein
MYPNYSWNKVLEVRLLGKKSTKKDNNRKRVEDVNEPAEVDFSEIVGD